MTKNRLLSITVIALILLNLVVLGFHFVKKGQHPGMPPHHRNGGPKNIIIKRLQLNETQIEAYEDLIHIHISQIREKEYELMEVKQHIYDLLLHNNSEEEDELYAELGRLSAEIEQIHLVHFKDLKSLCNEEQLIAFESLTKDLARLFSPPKPPKPPHRH